jgi:hypothetical protein
MEHISKAIERLIDESLAIEIEDAREAGALSFMARALVQATMPHKDPKETRSRGRLMTSSYSA